jgi:hypothetical protein
MVLAWIPYPRRIVGVLDGAPKKLRGVSTVIRESLQGMHMHYKVNEFNISSVIEAMSLLTLDHNTEDMRVAIPVFSPGVQGRFRDLCEATASLFHMTIRFRNRDYGGMDYYGFSYGGFGRPSNLINPPSSYFDLVDHPAQEIIIKAIDDLLAAPALQTISLEFAEKMYKDNHPFDIWPYIGQYRVNHDRVGMSGLQAFVRLKGAPALKNLHLGLNEHAIGDEGALVLSGLKDITFLDTLSLDLRENGITDVGVEALSGLKNVKFLHTLSMNLSGNQIGDNGLWHLSKFKDLPTLRKLNLGLNAGESFLLGGITDYGLLHLAELKDAPFLNTLELDLGMNIDVEHQGAIALAQLQKCPALRTLRLSLRNCHIGDDGATALAGLNSAPVLHTLQLVLDSTGITGALALAELKKSRVLHTIHLDVRGNLRIGETGHAALASLKDTVQTVHIKDDKYLGYREVGFHPR